MRCLFVLHLVFFPPLAEKLICRFFRHLKNLLDGFILFIFQLKNLVIFCSSFDIFLENESFLTLEREVTMVFWTKDDPSGLQGLILKGV